jgi:hypothetical protein
MCYSPWCNVDVYNKAAPTIYQERTFLTGTVEKVSKETLMKLYARYEIPECPVEASLELISGRWKARIL